MLERYRLYCRELDEAGGPSENGELHDAVIGLEEDILAVAGLPPAQKYRSILRGGSIDGAIQALKLARTEYEGRPIKDPTLLLVNAIINQADDPENILPMCGFSLHRYQEFMFRNVILASDGPEESDAIIVEMRKAEARLDDLGRIGTGGIRKYPDLYRSLIDGGMRHCDEYLIAIGAFDLDESEMDGRQFCLRGFDSAGKGMIDEAIHDLTEALRFTPGLATVYYNRAILYRMKGDRDSAMDDYNDAIRLDPEDMPAYCNRGLLRVEWGWIEEALEDFEKAVSLAPNEFHPLCNRGNAYASLGRHEEAVEDFTGAIVLKPDEAYLYCNRGISYYRLGREERALKDLWKAMDMGSELAEKFIREFYPEVRIER